MFTSSRFATAIAAAALLLAGCGNGATGLTAPGKGKPAPIVDLAPRCGATELQGLIGQDGATIGVIEHTGPLRVVHPGDALTQDYRPDRLNINLDADGLISRVWCG